MTYGSKQQTFRSQREPIAVGISAKRRVCAALLAAVMAPAAALSVTLLAPTDAQAAPAKKAACQIHAVLASKEGDGKLPKSLEFLRSTLEDDQFAAYKTFHLVDKKTLRLKAETSEEVKFSSGHRAKLSLLGGDDDRLKLHLELTERDGDGSLISTDYSIADNGLFMIGGGKFKQGEVAGKLFFAIQCARRS